jgi:hypothetical protein
LEPGPSFLVDIGRLCIESGAWRGSGAFMSMGRAVGIAPIATFSLSLHCLGSDILGFRGNVDNRTVAGLHNCDAGLFARRGGNHDDLDGLGLRVLVLVVLRGREDLI